MKEKTSTEILEERIEELVREHIAAIRTRAEAAIARGFRELAEQGAKPAEPVAKRSGRRPASRRRTTEEVTDLAERLYKAVLASPGETMERLAPKVGAKARELTIVVGRLRSEGRLRTVGQRQQTQYFPTTAAMRAG